MFYVFVFTCIVISFPSSVFQGGEVSTVGLFQNAAPKTEEIRKNTAQILLLRVFRTYMVSFTQREKDDLPYSRHLSETLYRHPQVSAGICRKHGYVMKFLGINSMDGHGRFSKSDTGAILFVGVLWLCLFRAMEYDAEVKVNMQQHKTNEHWQTVF